MEDKIKKDIQEIQDFKSDSIAEIEEFRIKFLGKKGLLNSYFVEFKSLDSTEKKNAGRLLNELKNLAQDKVEALKASSSKSSENKKINDISRPGDPINIGSRHPISVVKNRIIDIFSNIGFTISEGPEIEDDWHNFSALNLPEHHPARDMQDTFFIEKIPTFYLGLIQVLFRLDTWRIINPLLGQFHLEEFIEMKQSLPVLIVFFIRLKDYALIKTSALQT